MTLSDRSDPFLSFRFRLEVEGLEVAGFNEVSGLKVQTEVLEYKEGGQNAFVHQLPGATTYPGRLVLKRGLSEVQELWDWFDDVSLGMIERRNGSVKLIELQGGEQGKVLAQWDFFDGYPVSWTGPEFQAGSAQVAFETLELVHRGFYRVA